MERELRVGWGGQLQRKDVPGWKLLSCGARAWLGKTGDRKRWRRGAAGSRRWTGGDS